MRLFVALEVPPEVRRELDRRSRDLRAGLPKARWVRPEAMHLTLAFLGETDGERLPGLFEELAAAFRPGAAMELRVAGFGAFPPRGRVRVLWAGVETAGDLAGRQRRVVDAVGRALGAPLEEAGRPYHPHLTLARCRPPWPRPALRRLADALGSAAALPFAVADGALIESHLSPAGAHYEVLRRFPLAGAA